MIYQELSKGQFRDAFHNMGRGDQFSYGALGVLYDFFDEIGEDYELDVIAICCEFAEYADMEEFQADYGDEYETIEDIERRTMVLPVSGDSFIIQQF